MKISEIPWFDRPWTRLKKKGVSNLSNAELLAVVLQRGNFKENAIDLSYRVLSKHHFNRLTDLSRTELEKEFKNDIQAMRIQAMFEIFRRTNRLKKKGFKTTIRSPEDVFSYFEVSTKNLGNTNNPFFSNHWRIPEIFHALSRDI